MQPSQHPITKELCELCEHLLKDLSIGDIAARNPDGWDIGPFQLQDGNRSSRNVYRALRFDKIPCRFQHCKTLGDLAQSAKVCKLCEYLYSFRGKQFFKDEVDQNEDDIVTMGVISSAEYEGPNWYRGSIGTFFFLIGEDWKPRPFELQVYSPVRYSISQLQYEMDPNENYRARDSTNGLSLARPILESSKENDVNSILTLARDWITNCNENHPQCQIVFTFIPTRVIDVGPKDGSIDPHLYITSKKDNSSPYVVLSYCWGEQSGDNMNLKTTGETYQSRLEGIKMEELPLCCHDAVLITRRLGYRFLWIDALCIIQDQESKADWMHESAQMAQIYSQSALTISAGSSNRCNSRIFQPRKASAVGIQLEVEMNSERTSIGLRKYPKDLQMALSSADISKRGWTLQERMLSNRILHFTRSQMYWQCTSDEHSEDGRNNAEMSGGSPSHRSYLREDIAPNEVLRQWFKIVDRHKKLQLTNPGDQLPSLAGIARLYQPRFTSRYIFGLWESQLPQNLLWHSSWYSDGGRGDLDEVLEDESDIQLPSRPTRNLPSWSWASAPGSILHSYNTGYDEDSEALATIRYVMVDGDNEENMYLGQGKNGRIGLSGKLKRLKYEHMSHSKSWLADPDTSPYDTKQPKYNCNDEVSIDRRIAISRICWALAISRANGDDAVRCCTELLMLEEVNKDQGTFKRIGVASLSFERYSLLFGNTIERDIELL